MTELIRDTVLGHALRFITRKRVLLYEEERDPSLWQRYINNEKSGHMAVHGQTVPPETSDTEENQDNAERLQQGSRNSSATEVEKDATINHPSGKKVDSEKGKDVFVVDWWGPDDPENPRNWSRVKRVFVTFQICFLTFSVYIGSAIYTAGIPTVTETFGVSKVAATLGLTLFVLGYALGPMVWSPMSEIPQIGRNPVYIGTLFIFVLFQIPTALAVNFGMLLAFRFLTGFIGSPALATGGASIGDMYSPRKRTYGLAVWGIGAVSGPTLGPLVGGFAAEAYDWRWTIWELMWLSGFCLVLLVIGLPETSAANILYRRSRRLRKLTGNDKLVCEAEIATQDMTVSDIASQALLRPFQLIFTEPIVFALDMYIALIYGLLYIWFESFPIVFTGIYGFSLGLQGVAFVGIFVGVFVVLPPFVWYQMKYIDPQFNDKGELRPELRLGLPSYIGALAIPICLFWFGWTSRPEIHWIVPIIGTGLFSVGTFLLFNCVLNYLSDAYPDYAASALAGNDFVRSCFGGAFPLFATAMYTKLGVGWASSLLGFLGVAFVPIPFILTKYGSTLRHKSKFARKDF